MAIANYLNKLLEIKDSLNNRFKELDIDNKDYNLKMNEIVDMIIERNYRKPQLTCGWISEVINSKDSSFKIIKGTTNDGFGSLVGSEKYDSGLKKYIYSEIPDEIPYVNDIELPELSLLRYSTFFIPEDYRKDRLITFLESLALSNQVTIDWEEGNWEEGKGYEMIGDCINDIKSYLNSGNESYFYIYDKDDNEIIDINPIQNNGAFNGVWNAYFYSPSEYPATDTSLLTIDNVSYIGKYAFQFRMGIFFIYLVSSVKEIAEGAFAYCQSISGINLNAVVHIGKYAFLNAFYDSSFTFQNDWEISNWDSPCYSLVNYCLYNMIRPFELILYSVESIGDKAFYCDTLYSDYINMDYMYFGDSLEFSNIGKYILYGYDDNGIYNLSRHSFRLNANLLSTSFIKDDNNDPVRIKCKLLLLPPVSSIPKLEYYYGYDTVIVDMATTTIAEDAFENAADNLTIFMNYKWKNNVPENKWRGSSPSNAVDFKWDYKVIHNGWYHNNMDEHNNESIFPTWDVLKHLYKL